MTSKVLIVSGFYYPYGKGGPSNTSYWLAKALGKKGYEVTVVALNTGFDGAITPDTWIQAEYGKVKYVSYTRLNLAIKYCWIAIQQARKADVIHINSIFYPPSLLISCFCAINRKKVFWAPRGELSDNALTYSSSIKKIIIWVARIFARRVNFHVTSASEKRDVEKIFGSRINVFQIPNYLQLIDVLQPVQNQTFLYVGRLHPIKGLEKFIKALAASKNFTKSGFRFLIMGDDSGSYADTLKTLVLSLKLSESVLFIGKKSGRHRNQMYADAKFLVLPSESENFGNVVVEALCQGTPVIASKGTPWKLLEDYNAGYWIENSIKELSETIDIALNIPDSLYQQQRINALKLVQENFDIEKGVEEWIKSYQTAS